MTEAAGRLRVLTMNVLEPRYADGAGRRVVSGRALRELSPDVIALQEVTRAEADALRAEGWHVAPHPHGSPEGIGAVLAARQPFGGIRRTALHVTGRTARTPWCGAVAVELPLPEPLGGVLMVHHKPSWPHGYERERELQAVATARFVEDALAERPMSHTVLMGDFDASPEAASIRFWRGQQSLEGTSVCYQDAWARIHPDEPGHTPLHRTLWSGAATCRKRQADGSTAPWSAATSTAPHCTSLPASGYWSPLQQGCRPAITTAP